MALSVNTGTTTKATTTGTSVDLTFPGSTPTAGNLLVGGCTQFSSTPAVTITDNQSGNTYSDSGEGFIHSAASTAFKMFYAANINVSGTYTIHFTAIPAGATLSAFVYEVVGASTTPLAEHVSSTGTASGGSYTSATITNSTNADSILFAGESNNGNVGGDPLVDSAWTMDATNGKNTNGSTLQQGGLSYQIVSSTSGRTATWTVGGTNSYASIMAAFVIASGGGGVVVAPTHMMMGMGH